MALLLTHDEVRAAVSMADAVAAMERGFREQGEGQVTQPPRLNTGTVGRAPGRTSADQITLFKSVGTAVQDVALAALVYQRARERGLGTEIADFPILKG